MSLKLSNAPLIFNRKNILVKKTKESGFFTSNEFRFLPGMLYYVIVNAYASKINSYSARVKQKLHLKITII